MSPERGRAGGALGKGRRILRPLHWVSGLSLCASDPAGLQDNAKALLDPVNTRFEAPGVQIVSGPFEGVELQSNSTGTATFSARKKQDDDEHLLMINVDWGAVLSRTKTPEQGTTVCDAGASSSLAWSGRTVSSPVDAMMAWVFQDEDGDGFGKLRFMSRDCTERMSAMEGVRFDSLAWAHSGKTWAALVLTDQNELHMVDPYLPGSAVIAEDVTRFFVSPDSESIWSVEAGELVERRVERLELIARWGDGVTEVTFNDNKIFFSDKNGLFAFGFGGTGPTKIADEGCQALATGDCVFYFSPCHTKRLAVSEVRSSEFPTVSGPLIGPSLDAPVVAAVSLSTRKAVAPADSEQTSSRILLFITSNDASARGTSEAVGKLHLAEVSGASANFHSSAAFSEFVVREIDSAARLGSRVILRWTGVAGDAYEYDDMMGGAALEWLQGPPRFPGLVGSSFVSMNREYFLTHFDGRTLHLMQREHTLPGEERELATDLLYDGQPFQPRPPGQWDLRLFPLKPGDRMSGHGAVFVTDDGTGNAGTLRTFPLEEGARPSAPLTRGVRVGSVEVLNVVASFAYLSAGPERRLHVYTRGDGLVQSFANDVSTYFEIFEPTEGLIYVVDSGKDRGIWFARAR